MEESKSKLDELEPSKTPLVKNQKLRPKFVIPVVLLCIALGYAGFFLATHAASANVTVNFNNPITALDPNAFSGTISTYGGANITSSQKQDTNLKELGLGVYRIPIQWNNGNPIS